MMFCRIGDVELFGSSSGRLNGRAISRPWRGLDVGVVDLDEVLRSAN